MCVISGCSFKTAIFSKFLKVAMARSSFMKEMYHARFVPEFSVSVLKEIIALVESCLYEAMK